MSNIENIKQLFDSIKDPKMITEDILRCVDYCKEKGKPITGLLFDYITPAEGKIVNINNQTIIICGHDQNDNKKEPLLLIGDIKHNRKLDTDNNIFQNRAIIDAVVFVGNPKNPKKITYFDFFSNAFDFSDSNTYGRLTKYSEMPQPSDEPHRGFRTHTHVQYLGEPTVRAAAFNVIYAKSKN
jgi:hypothetical protein